MSKKPRGPRTGPADGWSGWDQYAPFYDWENAQTLGRRDLGFWRRTAARATGPVLELGCGTGRLSLPLAASGVPIVGLDRSSEMLARAGKRLARRRRSTRIDLVRGDMRSLPFRNDAFGMVFAPYGVLQSLTRDRDLSAALRDAHRVLTPGGLFGLDLVPDVPNWQEYHDRVQLRGRLAGGAKVTLIESVQQDRRRFLTTFDQRFVVTGVPGWRKSPRKSEHRFQLTFRTLPVSRMTGRLERAGFAVEAVFGSYRGAPWDEGADVWLVLARKRR
jgi:ubiquinone/menaquinone biosynthesis C-methylase UbiE